MALTYTPAGTLGSECPDFTLPSVDGKTYSRSDFLRVKGLVVMFICNHCPYVKAIEDRIIQLAHDYTPQNIQFLGICSNDHKDHPEDAPAQLLQRWSEKNYGFPYLIDEEQTVAKAFGAVCTPDLYLFDSALRLRYRGRFDDSWRNPANVHKRELREAIAALLEGRSYLEQHPAMGCSIKWKTP
ncbi:MAG: thioredoxin family protein [Bdellovibrionales bacterium]|nr:thioredoxin family protein [Bdellovibrionales bacterium]